ncbi:glycosyltransferase family 4 protein [Sphingomonas sp. HH69]
MGESDRERQNGPRVLWISHGYGYGGDFMYFGEIFRQFRERFPSMAVAVDRETPYRNPYNIPLLPIMQLMRKAIRRHAPDGQAYETEVTFPGPGFAVNLVRQKFDVFIIIEFTAPALIATLVATLSRRKKLVLLVESDPALRGASRNPLVRRIKRWAVARADAIQTNNVRGRRYLVEDLGADPQRVEVAPYLTSRPPGASPVIARREGMLRLLFVNSINARKGVREMLEAIALLDPVTRETISLTVVGDGPQRAELEAFAHSLGMGERLHFAGRKSYDSLGPYYADADVLLIPSLADYRSLAGFEGLSYGLVLLASSKDGATEETVIEGRNGYAIDPSNPSDLAARIAQLASDPDTVMAMREQSFALYEQVFSLDRIADNLASSVNRALAAT